MKYLYSFDLRVIYKEEGVVWPIFQLSSRSQTWKKPQTTQTWFADIYGEKFGHLVKAAINPQLLLIYTILKGEILKSVKICYKCIHFGLFLHPHSYKLAIYAWKSVDISNQTNLFCGHF